MRHNPFALFGPTPVTPAGGTNAADRGGTPTAVCSAGLHGRNVVEPSSVLPATAPKGLIEPSNPHTADGCLPTASASTPASTPAPQTLLQLLTPPPPPVRSPPRGPAVPDAPQPSSPNVSVMHPKVAPPQPTATPDRYTCNFTRLSELKDAGCGDAGLPPFGKRGRSLSAPADPGAKPKRQRATSNTRSWSLETSSAGVGPSTSAVVRTTRPKATGRPKGRWRFHDGQRCFLVGKQQFRGQQAWRLYQRQQRGRGKEGTAAGDRKAKARSSSSKDCERKQSTRRISAGAQPSPARHSAMATSQSLAPAATAVHSTAWRRSSGTAFCCAPAAVSSKPTRKQGLLGIHDQGAFEEEKEDEHSAKSDAMCEDENDDLTELSETDACHGAVSMELDVVDAIVAKYSDYSGQQGSDDPELQAALTASLRTAAEEHLQRLRDSVEEPLASDARAALRTYGDPPARPTRLPCNGLIDSEEDDLPLARGSRPRPSPLVAGGPSAHPVALRRRRQATLEHCLTSRDAEGTAEGDGRPSASGPTTLPGPGLRRFLRAPFRPNVVGSGPAVPADYYEGGAVDAAVFGAVYETMAGWAH
eukprot:GGOE01003195.1.p1 GENE.GGOE01003195.1~~GGOE01003195.1.p1  ORF type:complete len:606 (-),score=87.81 GGOE01003195.1:440-2200(-)